MVTRAAVGTSRYLNCRTVAESAAALPDTREAQVVRGRLRISRHTAVSTGEEAQDGGHPTSSAARCTPLEASPWTPSPSQNYGHSMWLAGHQLWRPRRDSDPLPSDP
jgi:hypothetical protein